MTGRRRAALADDLLDLAAHGFERDAEALERLGRDAFTLVDEPEQDVLGADVAVIQEAGLLLCEHHDPAGPVGETFEHGRPFHNDDVSGELSVHPTGACYRVTCAHSCVGRRARVLNGDGALVRHGLDRRARVGVSFVWSVGERA